MRNLYRNPAYDLLNDPDPRFFDNGSGENGPSASDCDTMRTKQNCDYCGGSNDVDSDGACTECREAWENDPPICWTYKCENECDTDESFCPKCLKKLGVKSTKELLLTPVKK